MLVLVTALVPMPLKLSTVSLPVVSLKTNMFNQSLMFFDRNFNGLVSVDNAGYPIIIQL